MSGQLLGRHGADLLSSLIPRTDGEAPSDAPLAGTTPPAPLPEHVADFLVRLRLLHGIPFGYLVPDEHLLPNESVRFFLIDEAWLDAASEGVLAVGSSGSRDTGHTNGLLPGVHDAVRSAVPLAAEVRRRTLNRRDLIAAVRDPAAHDAPAAAAPPRCGLLLRSALVSGWPGMAVRAFRRADLPQQTDPSSVPPEDVVPVLRMEQLAPSVLLVLFPVAPALVWFEEPHHGIQLGIDPAGHVTVVTPAGREMPSPEGGVLTADVPMRQGAEELGVVDVAGLTTALADTAAAHPGVAPQGGAAALALQLLRPPVRQRFVRTP